MPKIIVPLGFFTLLIPMNAAGATVSVMNVDSAAGFAFARYLASVQGRNVFTEAGPVAVQIDATLPSLYKESRLVAIREIGESERSEYRILQVEGDPIVSQEVIASYLLMEQWLENMPSSSLAITPANYNFQYKGQVGAGDALAYVYKISPKKKRDGLIQGQLWIDSNGAAILEVGRFVKMPFPFCRKIELVRDTDPQHGTPRSRITHVNIETRHAGHGELTIVEVPLAGIGDDPQPQAPSWAQN